MSKTIDYDPPDGDHKAFVVIDKIVHVARGSDGLSIIHLSDGKTIISKNSIDSILADIESADKDR